MDKKEYLNKLIENIDNGKYVLESVVCKRDVIPTGVEEGFITKVPLETMNVTLELRATE